MAIETGTVRGNGRPFSTRVFAAIGGAALVIAALGALSAHQISGQRGSAAGAVSAVSHPIAASFTGNGTGDAAPRGLTYYLAGSAEQATAAYAALRAQNTLLFENGAPDREATVRLVASDAEEAQVRESVATVNTTREQNGLGPIEIVDLQSAAPGASAVEPIAAIDPVRPR